MTKQDILDTYSDVFTGIGKLPGLPYKFQLKPNAKPTLRHTPRKVPIHLQDAFHEEIRNLEALGILEETKNVTEWVNSFVIVEKKIPIDSNNSHSPGHSMTKKLRICLDPRDLNEALEREPYYTCSIEEIMGKFHGMTRFTITDFNKGYWMVSRIEKIHNNGLGHWKVSVDLTSNGFHCSTRHVPKEIGCIFP